MVHGGHTHVSRPQFARPHVTLSRYPVINFFFKSSSYSYIVIVIVIVIVTVIM